MITKSKIVGALALLAVAFVSVYTWPTTITNARLIGGTFSKSTAVGKVDVLTFRYNATAGKWDQVAPMAAALS